VSDRPADALGRGAELGVVVAYGRLIRPELLAVVPMVNVHFSLLPRWRGAAPVERAILAGDEVTGVCLMALEVTLDTGPVYARVETPIGENESATELRRRLAKLGNDLLVDALAGGVAGLGEPVAQVGEATTADKLTVEDLRLDFTGPARQCHRVVRVGRAWTTFRAKRLLVHRAELVEEEGGTANLAGLPPGTLVGDLVATGSGALRLVEVQAEGRQVLSAAAFLAGARPKPGERLGGLDDPASPPSR
jgi:methionyl-tRNA formyltransferase